MTITAKEDNRTTHVLNVIVSSITDKDMVLSSEWTVLVNGKEAHREVYEEERWVRVTKDYESAFLGTWEGKVTRDLGDPTGGQQVGRSSPLPGRLLRRWHIALHPLAGYKKQRGTA